MIDVLVAGGGPAGLLTALAAAGAGLEVVVLEPRDGPVDKACGEGLMPGVAAGVTRLAGPLVGAPLRGITYLDATGHEARAVFHAGEGRGVRRTELASTLLAAADRAGVTVLPGRVGEVRQDGAGVSAGGLRARYLVAADGLHSPVRRQLGLDAPAHGPARWGLRQHYACAPFDDRVHVHWAAGSEAYVTPVGPDLVGVAVLTTRRGAMADQLAAFPHLLERLGSAEVVSATRGAGPLRQRVRSRVAGRVLLVGDAAGYVDALTGEGIGVALAGARAAAACLAADRPAAYEQAWARSTRRARWLTHGLAWAGQRPGLRRRLVPAAQRLPAVFDAAVAQLAG